jgi:hypothetical protein
LKFETSIPALGTTATLAMHPGTATEEREFLKIRPGTISGHAGTAFAKRESLSF